MHITSDKVGVLSLWHRQVFGTILLAGFICIINLPYSQSASNQRGPYLTVVVNIPYNSLSKEARENVTKEIRRMIFCRYLERRNPRRYAVECPEYASRGATTTDYTTAMINQATTTDYTTAMIDQTTTTDYTTAMIDQAATTDYTTAMIDQAATTDYTTAMIDQTTTADYTTAMINQMTSTPSPTNRIPDPVKRKKRNAREKETKFTYKDLELRILLTPNSAAEANGIRKKRSNSDNCTEDDFDIYEYIDNFQTNPNISFDISFNIPENCDFDDILGAAMELKSNETPNSTELVVVDVYEGLPNITTSNIVTSATITTSEGAVTTSSEGVVITTSEGAVTTSYSTETTTGSTITQLNDTSTAVMLPLAAADFRVWLPILLVLIVLLIICIVLCCLKARSMKHKKLPLTDDVQPTVKPTKAKPLETPNTFPLNGKPPFLDDDRGWMVPLDQFND